MGLTGFNRARREAAKKAAENAEPEVETPDPEKSTQPESEVETTAKGVKGSKRPGGKKSADSEA